MKLLVRIMFMFLGIHETDALSVLCSDFRYFFGTLKLYRHLGISCPDEIKIPGGPMSIVKRNELVLGWIKTLHKLHGFKTIYLVSHSGCGAYKEGGISFTDDAAEQAFHENQLRQAAEVIREILPEVKVRLIYACLTANHKLIEYIEL